MLTTLGVYLGLVLVGATPVLGHAATTRVFDVTDEVEIKDDLDRKPDDKRSPLAISIGNYYSDLEYLIDSLEKLNKSGEFDLGTDAFEVSHWITRPCVAGNTAGSYTAERFIVSNDNVLPLLKRTTNLMTDGYDFADCVSNVYFTEHKATSSHFVLKFNSSGLSLEVSGFKKSQEDTAKYLRDLKAAWDQFKAQTTAPAAKQIYDGTEISSVGNNILVVTRLPRAALDRLLAKDAKAAA